MSFFDEADEPAQRRAQHRADAVLREAVVARRPISSRSRSAARSPPAAILIVLILIVLGRPQLPGQRAQQRAQGLQQQRRLADPAVRPDRRRSCSTSSRSGGRLGERRQPPEPDQPDPAERRHAAQQGQGAQRSRRDEGAPSRTSLLALQMRRDGIAQHRHRDPAGARHHDQQGRGQPIAAEMARFYASDVVYKDYAVPLIDRRAAPRRDRRRRHQRRHDRERAVPPRPRLAARRPSWPRKTRRHGRRPPRRQAARPARTATRSTRSASAAPRCRPARPTRSPRARRRRSRSTSPTAARTPRHNVVSR